MKRKIFGILLTIGSIYIPFFIGFKFLPNNWARDFFTYWWTIPTMFSLATSILIGFVVGIEMITYDGNKN